MPKAVSYRPSAPAWQPLRSLARHQRPSPAMQDWLQHSGSLTARLIDASEGQFHVEIVRQFIGVPELNERKALGMKRPSLALIREVMLCGHNQPWVFARSLLPLSSLTGGLRHLRKQTTRPLGAFLFSQPQLTRSAIAVARISRDHAYMPDHLIGDDRLWGRRSVFYLQQKPLLVSEVFLPAFVARLDGKPGSNNLQ
ncbi:MAG: chorismate lyase [Cellvibrio sp.]|uniref:chorismate--pyruvate lyase family protein n=1 Tax=Cellvibrio sp. TaxID=1965322 RepID=UPI0031AAD3BB